jgi:predicted phosphodiesterase
MRLQLLSDLHLEVNREFRATPAPGAELLVLAGDIATPAVPHFGLEAFSPKLGNWPVPVLYVPGNHEYDGMPYEEAHARLRDCCERFGIGWLEGEVMMRGEVRLVGSTLWSDFAALADSHGPKHRERQFGKALRAADFYLLTTGTTRNGAPFDALSVRELGLQAQAWLRAQLAQPWRGKTVVVTHFAPSLQSHDPRYGLTPGTAGFCNALDALVAQADGWLHGHLHCAFDYRIGRCRVVANPLGYASKGEQAGFAPRLVVEV